MANGAGSDVLGHFQSGFDALRRYPVLVVPPLAIQVVVFLLLFLVWGGTMGMGALMGGMMGGGGGAAAGGTLGFLAGAALFVLLTGLSSLIVSGVVVVMARDALAGREPAIGQALNTVVDRLIDVLVASALVALVVVIASVFFVIPGLIAAFFLIFTLPAVLLDGQGGVAGLRRSFDLVKANVGSVAGLVIGVILIAVTAAIAGWIVHLVPVLGSLASAAINGILISYVTVVAVAVYQTLPRPAR